MAFSEVPVRRQAGVHREIRGGARARNQNTNVGEPLNHALEAMGYQKKLMANLFRGRFFIYINLKFNNYDNN